MGNWLTDEEAQRCNAYRNLLIGMGDIPQFMNAGAALRAAGIRHKHHPGDVGAALFKTRLGALIMARANREAFGHEILVAALMVDNGWLTISSLEASLTLCGVALTDPAKPDGRNCWVPTRQWETDHA